MLINCDFQSDIKQNCKAKIMEKYGMAVLMGKSLLAEPCQKPIGDKLVKL